MSEDHLDKYKKSSFAPAFLLLGKKKKKALCAVYAFARLADDIADDETLQPAEKEKLLYLLRKELSDCFSGKFRKPLFTDIYEASASFYLKEETFTRIIDGVSMDIKPFSYRSYNELERYMNGVAAAPGLLTLQICGYTGPAEELSIKLGHAVQLTNIIRDIYSDARAGRFYIPQEDLDKFSVSRESLSSGEKNEKTISLLEFEAFRAEKLYSLSDEIISASGGSSLLVTMIIKNLYFSLLKKIRAENFDIINKIPEISRYEKLKAVFNALF
ncbi:MAG: phytoene/squalene synthase family protein [Elusimicrobiota bacterium]